MRASKKRPEPVPAAKPAKPAWQQFIDQEERPSREDLAAHHDAFLDSLLEPVPLPRWLRGRRRRGQRDKLS